MELILIFAIIVSLVVGVFLGVYVGRLIAERKFLDEIKEHRKDAVMKSRAVLTGQFSEQLAPYFPDFPYNPNECKFIGKPIDFIVFKGLDNKENPKIDEIVFVEVKSGKSKLSKFEKSVKEAVEDKRVRFEEYNVGF